MTRRTGNTTRIGAGMFVAAWVLLLGILTVHFSGWLDARHDPSRSVTGTHDPNRSVTDTLRDDPHRSVTGTISELGVREVRLSQNWAGHYVARGKINGSPVRFILDTGATTVAIPSHVAQRLGLQAGRPQLARTANGTITTYDARLDEVSLGTIRLRDVRADINPHMEGEEILLGMSFLRNLELVQRDGSLTLRQYTDRHADSRSGRSSGRRSMLPGADDR